MAWHARPRTLRLDCFHEFADADNVHHTRQVIAEHVECHFGGNLRQGFAEKVRRTHAHFQRRERMLDGFAAHAHGLWVFVQARLYGLDDVLMLPPPDAAFIASRALRLERARGARLG